MSDTSDLFADQAPLTGTRTPLGPQAVVLRGWALPQAPALWSALQAVVAQAPFRHMLTPGGQSMSVPLTNCGALGWTSSRDGYRYRADDPDSGRPWPALPEAFARLAERAAAAAGFAGFAPDACLINRYQPGTRLTLHQDRNERNFGQPIVSVSLGLPATFLFGGFARSDKTLRVPLTHGDVVVWGGVDRMRFHGVLPIKPGRHAVLGEQRINLTFRKVR